jgi:hypothetical protein
MITKPFADCTVPADSVEDFVARYYKQERLFDQHFPGYTQRIIDGRKDDIARQGYAIISRHESNTGQVVAYYPSSE